MTSKLVLDNIAGRTTAGSITIVGEGNSTTTNLQQGLAKAWACQSTHGGSFNDSFNYSSASDTATGKTTYVFTNNFGNADYAVCNTHYNRGAGPSNAAHNTTSQHQCDWLSATTGSVADINTDAGTQVCGDLA